MSTINRKLIAVAVGLALSSGAAVASHVPGFGFSAENFIVDPRVVGESFGPFNAGAINFSYTSEVDQFGGVSGGTSANFNQTGTVTFGAFTTGVGGSPIGGGITGLNIFGNTAGTSANGYSLYALFSGAGTITTAGATPGTANGTYTSFNVTLFVDRNNNTTFATTGPDVAGQGFTRIATGDTTDDTSVLTGSLILGGFHLSSGLANGDFDVIFNITGFGLSPGFFSTDVSGQRLNIGDFNGVISTPSNVFFPPNNFIDGEIRGSGNVSLAGVGLVPEPGSLALMGLALAGLGFARRKTTAAQQAV